MDRSKKILIAGAGILAIFVPLAVLGSGLIGEGKKDDVGRKARITLGTNAEGEEEEPGRRGLCWNRPLWTKGFRELDIEKLKEELDLTEEEVNQLTVLIEEMEDLKDQLKENMEAIRAIIGQKIKEKIGEKREECRAIFEEELRPLLEELKQLHQELREAIESERTEDVEAIRNQMQEVSKEIQAVKEKLVDVGCAIPCSNKIRERVETFRKRCEEAGERIRARIRSHIWDGTCDTERIGRAWEDLSEEDREALESLREEIENIRGKIQEAIKQVDEDTVAELREQIAGLVQNLKALIMEKGIECPSGG